MPRVRAGLECKQAGGDPVVRLQVPDLPQKIQKRSKTMRNEVIYDKNGRPDIMVVFTPSELGLPDRRRSVLSPIYETGCEYQPRRSNPPLREQG